MDDMTVQHMRAGHAQLRLSVPLTWKNHTNLRGEAPLSNNLGLRLVIGLQVKHSKPWAPSVYILDRVNGHMAWRLDVNESHRNRKTDGRQWDGQTHVNYWKDPHGDSHAVDPWFSLPNVPAVGAAPYREVFEAFCKGSGVIFGDGYEWIDPPAPEVEPAQESTEGEVP
ncbi:hypothetical protein [Angustibacter sp. Root456]|uniref:hypothetical protein n=1 Tax=Angustibacter sp. Root456 TaxID=1736539 RepID=UPI0007016D1B|nr:hypothetical protein [Angustibacter sp. Root456]KQX65790.1 hypothetical protein ASD06_09295 [Angustibacter sp. Root456]